MINYIIFFGKDNGKMLSVTVETNNLFLLKLLMVKHGLIADLTEILKVDIIPKEKTI